MVADRVCAPIKRMTRDGRLPSACCARLTMFMFSHHRNLAPRSSSRGEGSRHLQQWLKLLRCCAHLSRVQALARGTNYATRQQQIAANCTISRWRNHAAAAFAAAAYIVQCCTLCGPPACATSACKLWGVHHWSGCILRPCAAAPHHKDGEVIGNRPKAGGFCWRQKRESRRPARSWRASERTAARAGSRCAKANGLEEIDARAPSGCLATCELSEFAVYRPFSRTRQLENSQSRAHEHARHCTHQPI